MSFLRALFVVFIYLAMAMPAYASDAPVLPAGLGPPAASKDPKLPEGLSSPGDIGAKSSSGEPSLPFGLDGAFSKNNAPLDRETSQKSLLSKLTGFAEFRGGSRIAGDANQKHKSILESRLQLQWEQHWQSIGTRITADLLYDDLVNDHDVALESGRGWLDLREAYLLIRPTGSIDLKAGRQILTWGAGDLVFINDLFPKDWNSFFLGRDSEYLKAPSDAIRFSWFSEQVNLEIVFTPRFDADRFIDGSRISFFNPSLDNENGGVGLIPVIRPDRWFDDSEWAVRLYRQLGSFEIAVYGYQGYWKSPVGVDMQSGDSIFPKLQSFGTSIRGPLYQGIANLELGYYSSRDDREGVDPLIRNSEFRLLLGYEQELLVDLTGSVQIYWEQIQDYNAYRSSLLPGMPPRDENRLVWTVRLTRLLFNQNLTLSLFNFYSTSDQDGYLRLKANYKVSDSWQLELGLNRFYGEKRHTFFAQFEDNSNAYLSFRYGF